MSAGSKDVGSGRLEPNRVANEGGHMVLDGGYRSETNATVPVLEGRHVVANGFCLHVSGSLSFPFGIQATNGVQAVMNI